jgi:predicted GIY-YIG superfamily endonuclease
LLRKLRLGEPALTFGRSKRRLSRRSFSEGGPVTMWHVYILQSISNPESHYVGCTNNVPDRLRRHNSGRSDSQSRHTSLNGPWELIVEIGFADRAKAFAFERYLKSGSGRAFAKKHF